MITALFLGFVFFGVYQLMLVINQWAISGDQFWVDKQKVRALLIAVGIPVAIAIALLFFFKSKIKFK